MKILMTILKLYSGYYFETNNFKRALFCKKHIAGVILFSTCSLMLLYICNKFHETILVGIKVIVQTRFRKISKGHYFTKIVGGVTLLVLCTMSDISLFFCPVS